MNYLTTTNLRTQTSKLVKILKQNGKVTLIHRSEMIGVIEPMREAKPFDAEKFRKLLARIKPIKLVPREDREKVYRAHLEQKYGKDFP